MAVIGMMVRLMLGSGARTRRIPAVMAVIGMMIRLMLGSGARTRRILAVVALAMVVRAMVDPAMMDIWASRPRPTSGLVMRGLVPEAMVMRAAAVAAILRAMAGARVLVTEARIAVSARVGVMTRNRNGVGVSAVVTLAARLVGATIFVVMLVMRSVIFL
jgi:hypothetical protein